MHNTTGIPIAAQAVKDPPSISPVPQVALEDHLWEAEHSQSLPSQRGNTTEVFTASTTGPGDTSPQLPRGRHPLQLYSLATPSGQKIACALEELGLGYDSWYFHPSPYHATRLGRVVVLILDCFMKNYPRGHRMIDLGKNEQFSPEYLALSPDGKIPALVDYSSDRPVYLFESGSILLYLAEKTGRLLPSAPGTRAECINWLFKATASAQTFRELG